MNRGKLIYLDHSATTPVDSRVVVAMSEFMLEKFGNPSSVHAFGREAKEALDFARISVAKLINCACDDLFFTSGGTESDNLALIGYCTANGKAGDRVIVSSIEHSAVLSAAKQLETSGFRVTRLSPNSMGEITPEKVAETIDGNTIMVSIMHANNEVGTINDLASISKIVHAKGAVFHTDAVQSYGKIPISVDEMEIDMLSLSGHKIYGPKGSGALYVRNGIKLQSRQFGGHQESGIRSGTENLPGIVGLGVAADISLDKMRDEGIRQTELRKELIEHITSNLDGIRINGHPKNLIPGHLSLTFEGLEAESLLIALDIEGVAVSTGSACSSGSIKPSHVLTEIGLSDVDANSTVRITLGRSNTSDQIHRAGEAIVRIVSRLRFINNPIASKITAQPESSFA